MTRQNVRHTIYGLRLKDEKEVRYVGMTNGPIDLRLVGHFHAATGGNLRTEATAPFFDWLVDNRARIEVFAIGYAECREEAKGLEKAIVALCMRLEHRLFNRRLMPKIAESAA